MEVRYGLTDGETHTLAAIAKTLGVSRERVRQIEMAALGRLRHTIERKTLTQSDLL